MTKEVLAQGGIEKSVFRVLFLKLTLPNGEKESDWKKTYQNIPLVYSSFSTLWLMQIWSPVSNLHEIKAMGHRVCYIGGTKFSGSVLIDDAVIAAVRMLRPGPAQSGQPERYLRRTRNFCRSYRRLLYSILHSTRLCRTTLTCTRYLIISKIRYPSLWFSHGTSHRYVSKRVCEFLNIRRKAASIITCHIGNGGSIAAVKTENVSSIQPWDLLRWKAYDDGNSLRWHRRWRHHLHHEEKKVWLQTKCLPCWTRRAVY